MLIRTLLTHTNGSAKFYRRVSFPPPKHTNLFSRRPATQALSKRGPRRAEFSARQGSLVVSKSLPTLLSLTGSKTLARPGHHVIAILRRPAPGLGPNEGYVQFTAPGLPRPVRNTIRWCGECLLSGSTAQDARRHVMRRGPSGSSRNIRGSALPSVRLSSECARRGATLRPRVVDWSAQEHYESSKPPHRAKPIQPARPVRWALRRPAEHDLRRGGG